MNCNHHDRIVLQSCKGNGISILAVSVRGARMSIICALTLQTVIDGTRCHQVLLLDSDHVEYYELGLVLLVPDPVS